MVDFDNYIIFVYLYIFLIVFYIFFFFFFYFFIYLYVDHRDLHSFPTRRSSDLAIRVNSINTICLTKLDVLDGLDVIKVCIGYQDKDGNPAQMPSSADQFDKVTPVYKELPEIGRAHV